ncbi:conserved hypothetical protein [Magnetospirillum sp. UT-4]|nr:conserved hypothetical protein [Magnetospirillum sp. UT-4]
MSGSRWGQAKREVIALKPAIFQRLNEGLTIRQIWLELNGAGQVSVTLKNFYLQVHALTKTNEQRAPGRDLAARACIPAPVTVSSRPVAPSQEDAITAQFTHAKLPSMATLWGDEPDQGSK